MHCRLLCLAEASGFAPGRFSDCSFVNAKREAQWDLIVEIFSRIKWVDGQNGVGGVGWGFVE